jgi:hypothetical protein
MTGPWLISYLAVWVLLLANGIVIVSLLRNLAELHAALAALLPKRSWQPFPSELKAGDHLPEVTWQTLSDRPTSVSQLKGVPQAFAVVSPDSALSATYLERLAGGEDIDPQDSTLTNLVVVSLGDAVTTAELVSRIGLPETVTVLTDSGREVMRKWGISQTPVTVIVDADLQVVRQVFTGESSPTHEHAAAGHG